MRTMTSASPVVHESCDPVIQQANRAWWMGYTLGLDWENAGPTVEFTPHQCNAFLDGWEKGRREAENERLEFSDRYDAEVIADRMAFDDLVARAFPEHDSWPEQEIAACYGHRGGPEIGGDL